MAPNRDEHIVLQEIELLLKGIVLLIGAALSCTGWLDCYPDPLLLMPILLQLVLQEQILLYKRRPDFRLAPETVLRFTISVYFIAGAVFPWLSPRFAAAPLM